MSQDKFRRAQDHILEIKSLLKENKLKKALKTFQKALQTYSSISNKLLKGEQGDFHKLADKAVYMFNFDKRFRKVHPNGIKYNHGDEKALGFEMEQLIVAVDDYKVREKQKKKELIASKKKEHIEKGKEFLKEGVPKKAYILFRKAAKEFPDDVKFILKMGNILYKADRVEDAAEMYKLVQERMDTDVVFLNSFATMMRKLRYYERAKDIYIQAMDLSPDDEALMFNAARNYIEWRKFGEAYDVLKKAITINPDFTVAKKTIRAVEKKIFGKAETKL